jgi:hypothetical protein
MAEWKASAGSPNLASGQQELFPLTLTGFLPELPKGSHLEFVADVGGSRFYCKRDKNGLPIRATEWFATSLAQHLNIPVPDFAPILNPENGEVLFGSKGTWGTASDVAVKTFLTTPQSYDGAIGGETPWLGSHLSRLYVYDLFVGNPDRQLCNFLLVSESGVRRLLAFDFASANLSELGGANFPVAQSPTISVGRQLRKLHGFDPKSATEMLDWIVAVPDTVVEKVLATMPEDWLSESEKGRISGLWSDGTIGTRLAALRSGLEDESLL